MVVCVCVVVCLVQELNVRVVTVTADKRKYGVMLRAEPDHKVLGARLKAAFKTVLAAIKNLTDEELTTFQQSGEMVVGGHRLGPDDLRLIYTFDQTSDDTPNHYDAYSDNNVRRELGLILSITTGQSNLSKRLHRSRTWTVQSYYI